MKEYVYKQLEKINKAAKTKRKAVLQEEGNKFPLNMLLSLNFRDDVELDLPAGPPPYNRDESTHEDLFEQSLAQVMRRVGVLRKGSPENIPKIRREHMFIQILESIPPKEADVLIFAKDGALTELYPNITKELVKEVFPTYVQEKPNVTASN